MSKSKLASKLTINFKFLKLLFLIFTIKLKELTLDKSFSWLLLKIRAFVEVLEKVLFIFFLILFKSLIFIYLEIKNINTDALHFFLTLSICWIIELKVKSMFYLIMNLIFWLLMSILYTSVVTKIINLVFSFLKILKA